MSLPRIIPTSKLGDSKQLALTCYHSNKKSLQMKGSWDQLQSAILEYGELIMQNRCPRMSCRDNREILTNFPFMGSSKIPLLKPSYKWSLMLQQRPPVATPSTTFFYQVLPFTLLFHPYSISSDATRLESLQIFPKFSRRWL